MLPFDERRHREVQAQANALAVAAAQVRPDTSRLDLTLCSGQLLPGASWNVNFPTRLELALASGAELTALTT